MFVSYKVPEKEQKIQFPQLNQKIKEQFQQHKKKYTEIQFYHLNQIIASKWTYNTCCI